MNGLTPQTREEEILNTLLSAAGGETVSDLTAETRREQWYQNILDAIKGNNLTYTLNSEMRREEWLADFIEAAQEGGGGGAWDKDPTADGKTRLYIDVPENTRDPYLTLYPNGTVTIDWGDGTTKDTLTGTSKSTAKSIQHTYAKAGKYIITLSVDGEVRITGTSSRARILAKDTSYGNTSSAYLYLLKRAYIGSNVDVYEYAFINCVALERIVLPTSVTVIQKNSLSGCKMLKELELPSTLTEIKGAGLQALDSLRVLTIPNAVTTIGGSALNNAFGMKELHFKRATPPIAGGSAFTNLPTDCKIYVPTGTLEDYTSEDNYPNSETYTYIEE